MTLDAPKPTPVEPAQTRLVKELKHSSPLVGCRFDRSGRFVFAGAQDNSIRRWDLESGQETALVGHKSWVRALATLPQQKQLVSGDYQGRLCWWPLDAKEPTPVRILEAHQGWVRAIAVSPDGQTVATCGNDQRVKLWSAADGRLLRTLAGHTCHVYHCAFHPQGEFLVSGDHRGVVKHWALADGKCVRELDAGMLHKYDETFRAEIGGMRGMTFSADGGRLACSGITDVTNAFGGIGKPLLVLFDWPTGKSILLRPKENFQGTVWGAVFHPAGFVAAVGGGNGGMLWFWRPDQVQDFFSLKLPTNARDLDLSPDGTRLAVAFFDGAVRLYAMTLKSGT